MRMDHRKAVANGDDDPGIDTGQFGWQNNVCRDLGQAPAIHIIVPVDPKQIAGIRGIGIGWTGQRLDLGPRSSRVGQL